MDEQTVLLTLPIEVKMITIHIPKGATAPDIGRELVSARNIKDKKVRQSTLNGLNRIAYYL